MFVVTDFLSVTISSIVICEACVWLNSCIAAADVAIFPMAYTELPLSGPPNIGLVSALILAPVLQDLLW